MANKIKELRKENNRLDEKLNKEYQDVLTDMIVYIRGSKINEYNQELVYQDLVTMMLDSQERKQEVKELIGEDYKEFCDNILSEIPEETKEEKYITRIRNGLLYFSVIFSMFLLMKIKDIIGGNITFKEIPITLGELIIGFILIVIAILMVEYISKNSFKIENKKEKFIKFLVLWIIFMAVIVIPIFIKGVIITLPLIMYISLLLLALIVYRLLDKYLEKIMIRR